MNREERKSYLSKAIISKYFLPHRSCFTSWLFPNHLTITRMQFVLEMSAVAIIYIIYIHVFKGCKIKVSFMLIYV